MTYDIFIYLFPIRNTMRLIDRATNRLKALREAVSHAKQTCKKLSDQIATNPGHSDCKLWRDNLKACSQRILGYRREMQRASLERDQGYWDDRSALVTVLELWKGIKALRSDQGKKRSRECLFFRFS